MSDLFRPALIAALIAFTAPVAAQESTDDTAQEEDTADTGYSMGEEVSGREPGTEYVAEVFGDWEKKCIVMPEGQGEDPCQIYQLLKNAAGEPVAEVSMVRLPAGGQAVAGGTIVVPLETLLTQQLKLSVDGSTAKRYPFQFCAPVGCLSQVGFTADEVDRFKKGNSAVLTIVPAAAPDQKFDMVVSLSGFTAAYDSLSVPPARDGN